MPRRGCGREAGAAHSSSRRAAWRPGGGGYSSRGRRAARGAGGCAAGEFPPAAPPENARAEAALRAWLTAQEQHGTAVGRLRGGRRQRELQRDTQESPEDPYPLLAAFWQELASCELLLLTAPPPAGGGRPPLQLFSLAGRHGVAFCVFTSLRRVERFGERLAEQLAQGAERREGTAPEDPAELERLAEAAAEAAQSTGVVQLVGANGVEVVSAPAALHGTWLPAAEVLRAAAGDDPSAAVVRTVLNPLCGEPWETALPRSHAVHFLGGSALGALVDEVKAVFAPFLGELCPEVRRAWVREVSGGRVLLALDTPSWELTLSRIGWAKHNTAALESDLTSFSLLDVHPLEEVPSMFAEPPHAAPFYTAAPAPAP
eukprot:TRINITY_DN15061_c0_g1_i1.p1 TRINITY_DN15061_c0_g1~~TRINITY_DN15061_c0_g1_i1.p1  ORF type:complete len:373 (+),score=112.79 TRINITY_DN15061_c0_g1_i1:86-1204(+)